MVNITPGRIRRIRNLPTFKDKTDEEIIEYIKASEEKRQQKKLKEDLNFSIPGFDDDLISDADKFYAERYNKKINQLQEEYGVDMNDSNDAETLKALVRLIIQLEEINEKIRRFGEEEDIDDRKLKNLGDFQRGLIASITDLQDKLGISRKTRKEKQYDDIPQYLKEIRKKALTFWNRTTTPIECNKCQIELSRIWLNFPHLAHTIRMELECWKCHEKVVFVK